jgi:hypothetical protein
VLTSVVKWIEGFSNRMSIIIRIYVTYMRFAAYVAVLHMTFFHIFLFYFVSLYIWLHVLYASF